MEFVEITDFHEIGAAERGEIEAEFYSDGEVYANVDSLAAYRASIPTLTDAVPA